MTQKWQIGNKIKGKYDEYQVYKILGGQEGHGGVHSGMGIVYICYAIKDGLPVALKTFQERLFASKEAQEMFRREALIWTELERYPYIVRAHWIEEIGGQLFIVLEYVAPDKEGRNILTHYLRELSLADSLRFAIQFCYGMEYAYSKSVQVHRDIKPDNIMISSDRTVKITDFGLATVFDRAEVEEESVSIGEEKIGLSVFKTEGGRVVGTIPYMAPEQFEGKAEKKSDIYSFGIVLYEMASGGRLPFVGRTGEEWEGLHKSGRIPPIDSPLFPIIERCMRRRSPQFEDFASLREELEKIFYKEIGEKIQPPKIEALETWELINKGTALADLGRHNEAILCYDKALEINPMDALAWYNKGNALDDLGKLNEAILCYDKALEINPRNAEAWYNKGNGLYNLGKPNDAILCYDKALEINPMDALAWYNKGVALGKLGKPDEAILCYDKALEINPMDALAWYNKGNALDDLGKQNEAILCYDKALEINPRNAKAWYNKGIALAKLGKLNEAILCYDKALEINPRYAEAWYNKGIALYNLGKQNEAILCYDKALEINPRYPEAWNNKGTALDNLGKPNEAILCYDKALEINPRDAEAWYNKGTALYKLGKPQEAILCYDKALEINPRFAEAWYNKGTVLANLGKLNEALCALERFIEFAPAHLAPQVEQIKGLIHQLKGMG